MSRGVCPRVISERGGGCALYIPVIFRHGLDGVGVAVGWVGLKNVNPWTTLIQHGEEGFKCFSLVPICSGLDNLVL